MKRTDKREYILDVAEALFCRYGSRATTVRLIAEHAGINISMLNYYFRSKEKLFLMVLERRIGLFEQALGAVPGGDRGSIGQLTGYTGIYIDHIGDNLPFYRLMIREKLENGNPEVCGMINAYFSGLLAVIRNGIETGMAERKVRVPNADLVMTTISSLLVYVIVKAGDADFPLPPDDRLQAKAYVKQVLSAVITATGSVQV